MMNYDKDLNHVGKRMPYTTPPNFFDQLEQSVMQQVRSESSPRQPATPTKRRRKPHRLAYAAMAAAAAIATIIAICLPRQGQQADTIGEVEQAFTNLSDEDQDYILTVYAYDIFMNE